MKSEVNGGREGDTKIGGASEVSKYPFEKIEVRHHGTMHFLANEVDNKLDVRSNEST